jgi:hypothetical protein
VSYQPDGTIWSFEGLEKDLGPTLKRAWAFIGAPLTSQTQLEEIKTRAELELASLWRESLEETLTLREEVFYQAGHYSLKGIAEKIRSLKLTDLNGYKASPFVKGKLSLFIYGRVEPSFIDDELKKLKLDSSTSKVQVSFDEEKENFKTCPKSNVEKRIKGSVSRIAFCLKMPSRKEMYESYQDQLFPLLRLGGDFLLGEGSGFLSRVVGSGLVSSYEVRPLYQEEEKSFWSVSFVTSSPDKLVRKIKEEKERLKNGFWPWSLNRAKKAWAGEERILSSDSLAMVKKMALAAKDGLSLSQLGQLCDSLTASYVRKFLKDGSKWSYSLYIERGKE